MKIGIVNDHRGVNFKKELVSKLVEKGYEVVNYGTDTTKRTDYTKYGFKIGKEVVSKKVDFGIAICGSGIGISIACNKVKGIRCGITDTKDQAIHGKSFDFINVIALRAEYITSEEAFDIVEAYINTNYSADPTYYNRVLQIEKFEDGKIDEY